jgi:protein-S-isoprenylcysteine O-methyltransferase Ste14
MRSNLSLKVFEVVSSAIFIALVVLAWGDWRAFFASPARTGVVVISVIATVAALGTDASLSSGKREDAANRWVLAPLMLGSVVVTLLPPYLERIDRWTFDGDAARYAGLVLVALGTTLRMWPVFVLGHRFSGLVAIQGNHALVTTGPYRYVRHPSYLGALVFVFGWGFVFRTPIGIVFTALFLIPLVARMNSEERLLASEFGEPYEEYRRRTSRLVPGIY